jgi:hypothetical protein
LPTHLSSSRASKPVLGWFLTIHVVLPSTQKGPSSSNV